MSSVYAVYRKLLLETFKLFILMKALSKTRMKTCADKGSPCLVSLSNLMPKTNDQQSQKLFKRYRQFAINQ